MTVRGIWVHMSQEDLERVLGECVSAVGVPLRPFCEALLDEAFFQGVPETTAKRARCIAICLHRTIGELARRESA